MGADSVVYRAYRFAPAAAEEPHVYGACAPGWHTTLDETTAVDDWIGFVHGRGIERVCSIVPGDGSGGNLRKYREAFGDANVQHAPIPDGRLPDPSMLQEEILPFLTEASTQDSRAVVVGLAGIARTGVVLAGWLIARRGFDVDEAITTVRQTGRDPLAVVEQGEPSLADLHRLLSAFE